MASVVLGAAAGALINAAPGATAFAVSLATAIGSAVGGYIDSTYIFPAVFGDEGSQESRYGSVTVSTADEGSPIYTAFGRRVRVPALILVANDPVEVSTPQRVNKRRVATSTTWYSDIVIGLGKSYPALQGNLNRVLAVLADGAPIIDLRDDVGITTRSGTYTVNGQRKCGLIANYQQYADTTRNFGNSGDDRDSPMALRTTPRLTETRVTVEAVFMVDRVGGSSSSYYRFAGVRFNVPHNVPPGYGFMAKCLTPLPNYPGYGEQYPWVWMRASFDNAREAYLPNLFRLNFSNWYHWYFDSPVTANTRLGGFEFQIADNLPDGDVDFDLRRLITAFPVTAVVGDDRRLILRSDLEFPDFFTGIRSFSSGLQEAIAKGRFKSSFANVDDELVEITQERVDFQTDVLEGGADEVEFLYETDGVAYQLPSPRVSQWVAGNPLPAWRDMAVLSISNMNLSSFGSRLPNIEGIVEMSRTSLPEVLQDVCEHHGVPNGSLDVSEVPAVTVEGYRYSGIVEGSQALQPLLLVYDLLVQQKANKLRIFPRSSATVITIDESEWIANASGDRLVIERREQQRPIRSVSVTFFDAFNDLEPGTVVEPGFSESDGEDRSVSTNMVMAEEDARALAQRIIRDTGRASYRVQCSLPWSRAEIMENDVIQTTVNGALFRFRVMQVQLGAEMELVIEGISEPKVAQYYEAEEDVGDPFSYPQSSLIQPPPEVDAKVWQGFDWETSEFDERTLFVAASQSGFDARWNGAYVFISSDGESTWRLAASLSDNATVGQTLFPVAPLGESQRGAWQPNAKLAVRLASGELESVEEDVVRGRGSNRVVIGSEIAAFQTAEATADGEWILTGFVRGLAGTAASTHRVLERFVLLTDAVRRVPLRDWEMGRTIAVKVVPIGATLDEVESIPITTPGGGGGGLRNRIKPSNPVDVQGFSVTASGDGVNLRWLPVEHDDLEYYEVRTGDNWMGARVVGRTTDTTLHWTPPTTRSVRYQIRAKFRGGIWSPSVSAATLTISGLDNTAVVTEVVPVEGTVGGTGTGASEAAGAVTIDEGEYEALWTQTALVADAVGTFFWDVDWEGYRTDTRTIDELPDIIPATFAGWHWTGEGTDGSEAFPGVGDWTTPADYPLAASEYTDVMGYGQPGTPGDQTEIHIQARWDENGDTSYGDWEDFAPGWRRAKAVQIRARMRRVADHYQHTITRLTAVARS